MWDLLLSPGIEPGFPVLGVWSFSHWITREVPKLVTLKHFGLRTKLFNLNIFFKLGKPKNNNLLFIMYIYIISIDVD